MALLDADNSVPFIARYRKEATGALTDTQLRTISRAWASSAPSKSAATA